MKLFSCLLLSLFVCVPVLAEEPVDLDMVNKIRDEGFHRSKVMETLQYLTEEIGPRITNSPSQRVANEWTRSQLEEWGLKNSDIEAWGEFGRGWSFDKCVVQLVTPDSIPLFALPKAWTPGTDGPVRGEAIRVTIKKTEDIEKYKGKLKGKILLINDARKVKIDNNPIFHRHSPDDLCGLEEFPIPRDRNSDPYASYRKRVALSKAVREFYIEEGVLAVIELSSRDAGVIRVTGQRSYAIGEDPGPPQLAMITEHYNRLVRAVGDDQKVELEIDVQATFHEENPVAHNTIAEIPGSSKRKEVVMLGGHLDSWHCGTGATDNGAGVAVAMEAMRILAAIDFKPKRTIRVALWTGEEQGLLGSRNYVKNHFATRPEVTDEKELELPGFLRKTTWPIMPSNDYEKFSAYYNLDNGSGKIRGIYCQENSAVKPIFEAWLKPFEDLGADTVSLRNTGSTDHVPFDRVGLPGFQFIQDPLEYFGRTHHSHLDVYDRLQRDDLIQASIVMASFVYHTAMRDDLMPRKPMPREPEWSKEKKEESADEE